MSESSKDRRTGPYRSRDGILLGVCRGLAEHFSLSVFGVRCLVLIALLFTGFWPVLLSYIVAALLLKPKPAVPFRSDGEAEFYHSYVESRGMALRRLRRAFDDLQNRIQRVESIVTSREFDWNRRMQQQ